MGRRTRGALVVLALGLAVGGGAGCGSGDSAEVTTTPVSLDRCQPVSAARLREIAVGLDKGPRQLTGGAMVQSGDHPEVHLIAGTFIAENIPDPQVGVWAKVGPLDGDGPIIAVTRIAQAFSRWPAGTEGDGTGILDDGVAEAVACGAAASE